VVGYYKNIDVNPVQPPDLEQRVPRQEHGGQSRAYFMDLQAFGNAQGPEPRQASGFYGNLFRNDASASVRMKRFWQGYCDIASGGYELDFFNKTPSTWTPRSAGLQQQQLGRPCARRAQSTPSCARPSLY
jgi:hypothetical protein